MIDRSKSPDLSTFVDLKFDYPTYVTLNNGIKVYIVNSGDQDVCKLDMLYRGGLLEETMPLQSMALASMLVHGSNEYTSEQMSEWLDYNGAYMNAMSHDNFTQVSLNSLNSNLENVLPALRSVLLSPSIPEQEFDLLKMQIKSAYRNAKERVKYLSQMSCRGLYFGKKHPFAHMICDEDVERLTRDDVKAFHAEYYKPENCVMILSGKVGDKELSLLDKYYGIETCHGAASQINAIERTPSDTYNVLVNKEDALQSSVYMIHGSIPRNHHDYIKLRILITALGGYFGSRLMQNIREEKGYTYGISSMLVGRRGDAKIVISSECDTKYTYPLISEVNNEIKKLQNELMPIEELDMVKNCMLSDLAKTLDSPLSMASVVSSNILYSTGVDYFNRQAEEINRVSPEELLAVANKYIDADKFYIAIAGDEKQLKI